jgi:hypothetical protein
MNFQHFEVKKLFIELNLNAFNITLVAFNPKKIG